MININDYTLPVGFCVNEHGRCLNGLEVLQVFEFT